MGQRCLQINGDNLAFVGTAAVVRDIAAMADAYDGQGSLINYWGFSYGTVIGMYLSNRTSTVKMVKWEGLIDG